MEGGGRDVSSRLPGLNWDTEPGAGPGATARQPRRRNLADVGLPGDRVAAGRLVWPARRPGIQRGKVR